MKITGIVMLLNKYCIYACVYCISKAPLFEKLSLKKVCRNFKIKLLRCARLPFFFASHSENTTYCTYISSKASFLWRSPLFSIVCDTEIHFKKENGQLTKVINKVNYQEPQKIKIVTSSPWINDTLIYNFLFNKI